MNKLATLDEILTHVWDTLQRGAADNQHAFHAPVFATVAGKKPQLRTVILRNTDRTQRKLFCYTDIRSGKVKELQNNPYAQWLFYDANHREQIRAHSTTVIHHKDTLTLQNWDKIPPQSRGNYLGTMPPGMPSSTYTANLSNDFRIEDHPSQKITEKGYQNFCVLESEVLSLEFLALRKKGHIRAKFEWENEQWKATWLAP